jgi:hypothetical protein
LATAETAVSTAAVPEAEAPQPMGLVNCHIAIENPPFLSSVNHIYFYGPWLYI